MPGTKNYIARIVTGITAICLLTIFTAYPQTSYYKIDSLKAELEKLEGEEKADVYNLLFYAYRNTSPDSAKLYADSAYKKAQSLNYQNGIADATLNIGRFYSDQGQKDTALSLYLDARKIYESTDNKGQIGQTYNDISIIYAQSGDLAMAKENFKKAKKVFKLIKDTVSLSQSLNNIGIIFEMQERYDSALTYYHKSIGYKILNRDTSGIASGYLNLSKLYFERKSFDSALNYSDKSIDLFENLNNKRGLISAYDVKADVYRDIENYKKAANFYQEAYDIAASIDSPEDIMYRADELSNIYELLGEHEKALNFLKEFISYSQELNDQKKTESLNKFKSEFELIEKENEIKLLKAQEKSKNQLSILLACIALLLLLTSIYFIWSRKKLRGLNSALSDSQAEISKSNTLLKQQNEEITTQTEDIKAKNDLLNEMNQTKNKLFSIISHDIRGPLNSLNGFIGLLKTGALNQEETSKFASRLQEDLRLTTVMVRNLLAWAKIQIEGGALERVKTKIHPIIKDITALYNDRISGKNLTVKINIAEELEIPLEKDGFEVVIRNLISNAIKFTLKDTTVTINYQKNTNGTHVFSVTDQGEGITDDAKRKILNDKPFSTVGVMEEKGTGVGLFLCKDIIKRWGGELSIESDSGEGTTFSFTIP